MIDFDITAFTPVSALIGGGLIGLAAAVLILGSGHILGMSGIAQKGLGTLPKLSWQLVFMLGMAVATWRYTRMVGFPDYDISASPALLIVAGLLVGFGTRLGSGCTSGHGVCGLSRLSPRSLVATLTFMACGVLTATATNFLLLNS